jgi:hypothetical protein
MGCVSSTAMSVYGAGIFMGTSKNCFFQLKPIEKSSFIINFGPQGQNKKEFLELPLCF